MSEIKIIETSDGSQSLYHEGLNETYHSTHGAITESQHVFIKHGLEFLLNSSKESINILEVGFGTGLNALLALGFANNNQRVHLNYTTLEPYPLDENLIQKLKYHEQLSDQVSKEDFFRFHQCSWGVCHELQPNFKFTKHQTTLQEFETNHQYDLIFYDAFAPSKQAEMWELSLLEKLKSHFGKETVLVTYCARGQFKRDLASIQMKVETLAGPPGKKEMVRGVYRG
ncbi:tRNA (5-methylaminomethyl-2-thiouridine)(34)-methyltransferase MnmD [Roseivirga sp.]|uniref:tRNA (5-methylaminomethyl-2-thiouridine)(34)-methyltransferase MnmD n=1 Tax=Roseivirga sp. TaxID=1964215 RepID=UPI003B8BD720